MHPRGTLLALCLCACGGLGTTETADRRYLHGSYEHRDRDRSLSIRAVGVRLDDTGLPIELLAEGYVVVRERRDSVERVLNQRPAPDRNGIETTHVVDDEVQDFDAAAQAWLAAHLRRHLRH